MRMMTKHRRHFVDKTEFEKLVSSLGYRNCGRCSSQVGPRQNPPPNYVRRWSRSRAHETDMSIPPQTINRNAPYDVRGNRSLFFSGRGLCGSFVTVRT